MRQKDSNQYDPYDLTRGIRIYYEGKQYKDATPAKIHRHSKKGFSNDYSADIPPVTPSGINFLEQLVGHKLKAIDPVQFSSVVKEGGDF